MHKTYNFKAALYSNSTLPFDKNILFKHLGDKINNHTVLLKDDDKLFNLEF